jgi:hypothetical protein
MSETRVNQTPAQEMSIEERLNEIATLMLRGIKRLTAKSNTDSLNDYFSGLRTELKHSSVTKGDRNNDRETNDHTISDPADHGDA